MAFDFPNAPTDGQEFPAPGGQTYVYNLASTAWYIKGTATGGTIISDTPPAGAVHGDLWYESDSGNTFIRYDDGTSSQWVQVNVGSGGGGGGLADAPSDGVTYGRKDGTWSPAIGTVTLTISNTSGTYNPPVGLKAVEVTCVGGGAGATGAGLTIAGQSSAGGGGGGGGTAIKLYTLAELGGPVPYTVGAGGTSSGGSGLGAGSTTFGTLTGGGGGPPAAVSVGGAVGGTTPSSNAGGPGGAATGGQIHVIGGYGSAGIRATAGAAIASPGNGGVSMFSSNRWSYGSIVGVTQAAIAGQAPGGGATGGANGQNQPLLGGQNGGAGCIMFREYF